MPLTSPLLPCSALTGKADFVVFDTDYDSYVAVFECDRAGLLHRRSVAVLSRSHTIDEMFVRRVSGGELCSYSCTSIEGLYCILGANVGSQDSCVSVRKLQLKM